MCSPPPTNSCDIRGFAGALPAFKFSKNRNFCAFKSCRNYYSSKNKYSGISYHTFPKDPFMEQKWACIVQAERNENDWRPRNCSRICSVHFKSEDKVKTLNGLTRLKATAVPEIVGFVINNEEMNNGSNQDALEHLHSSDPSLFASLWSQTALKNKIKEAFDRHERETNISNLHTHIDIKQEDLEDIDSSVANPSSASCSETNSACGSPNRESHIETITKYEPQTTIDVTVMKEEPGSPLSDVSIHSDADDSPEEQKTKNTLREKMEMLKESKDILKSIYKEIGILKRTHRELVSDIKYLKNMSNISKKKCKFYELNEL